MNAKEILEMTDWIIEGGERIGRGTLSKRQIMLDWGLAVPEVDV